MGMYESQTRWRLRGSTTALWVWVGLMLLGPGLTATPPNQTTCPTRVTLVGLRQPQYQSNPGQKTEVGFLSDFVQSFLQTVQPHPFPTDLLLKLMKDPQKVQSNQDTLKEVLVYQTGFLVCAAIGVLYIVFMPLVGFFLACCRCCGNCGGYMYQEQTSKVHCWRRALYWSTFIITLIILAGNICMFKSNEDLKVNVDHSAEELNTTLGNLQTYLHAIPQQLDHVVNESYKTVSAVSNSLNACQNCDTLMLELKKLNLDPTPSVPGQSELQSAVNKVNQTNLNSKADEGEAFLRDIPQQVTNSTRDTVQRVKQQLADIRSQISMVTKDVPISGLTNASDALVQIQGEIHTYSPQVARGEYIRWAVCVALCCVVLLVVLCNVLGLLLGPVGLSPKVDPTERSCTADCGGTFLMMGAGFSFLFSWLFMLVVLLLFLLGGNVYTIVCKPWSDGKLLQIIDTPGLIPGFELGPMLGLKSNLTVTDIYRDCGKDLPLWTTLHLSELVDLNNLLNVSKYTEEIQRQFDNTDIPLPTTTLLSADDLRQFSNFSDIAGGVNFTAVTQQPKNSTVQKELLTEAEDLQEIQRDIETTINPELVVLNSTIQDLRAIVEQANKTLEELLTKVRTAQDFLSSNSTALIVKNESQKFLDCQIGYFTAYAKWANRTITQQIGRCGPVAQAVDTAEIIVCSQMVESLNAFWFSLGWCMIFFIPSIIFSVKLAKYYRIMKHTNGYDNHLAMNPIPRAQVKPY
ncbi:prominin-2 [Aplochiton taeniatus]